MRALLDGAGCMTIGRRDVSLLTFKGWGAWMPGESEMTIALGALMLIVGFGVCFAQCKEGWGRLPGALPFDVAITACAFALIIYGAWLILR